MNSNCVSITVRQGTLKGLQSVLPNGAPYYSFKGVPYATPPVGELRFELPVPLEKFPNNPLECFKEGNMCLQNNVFNEGIIEGSEDCLYLNIYTPNFKPNKPLPVMVYIHGGAFTYGNANSDYYLPLYLMQEGVVVVTFTFRVGIFGYLYLPEGGIRGNIGLHDQVAAFKWIKDNISNFGGDPQNLTMFGVSSGAVSIHMHLLSPESKKYISKAILQGGNAFVDWCHENNPPGKARKLAQLMGCTAKDDKDIGKFLKSADSLQLHQNIFKLPTPENFYRNNIFTIKPVIEGNKPKAIIPHSPWSAIRERNAIDIPLMMGFSNKEGIAGLIHFEKNVAEYDRDLLRFIPKSLNLSEEDSKCFQIIEEIRQFYFKGKQITINQRDEMIDLLGDTFIISSSKLAAEIHSRFQHKSPLYMYRFSFDAKLNYFKKNHPMIEGASHADDRFYIFQKSFDDGLTQPGSREELTVKRMCRMWSNFAKYGNPTPCEDDIIKWKWSPIKKIDENDEFVLDYLEIDDVVKMGTNPDKERTDFWRNIFRKYSNCSEFVKTKL